MKDSVILGNGNSRYLKSVKDFKTLYPTYDDFVAALVAGTLPIDLNGINAAGFQQVGDALGKSTLLKDTTAALYKLESTAVPDDVFVLLKSMISNVQTSANGAQTTANGRAKIETFSYVGNNSTSKKITFSFNPKCVIITSEARKLYTRPIVITIIGVQTVCLLNDQSVRSEIIDNKLYLQDQGSNSGFVACLNNSNDTYYGIAIG